MDRKFQKFIYRDFEKKKGKDDFLMGRDLEEFLKEERYDISKDLQKAKFVQNERGILATKGCELGRFNMGSTVVLFFEADEGFKFEVKEGQKVKYGDVVGRYHKKEEKKE